MTGGPWGRVWEGRTEHPTQKVSFCDKNESLGKDHTRSAPCLKTSVSVVDPRSFLTSEGGTSVACFLQAAILRAINVVMPWFVLAQKVTQVP